MKSINECIENKDWKALSIITHKQHKNRKIKENKRIDDEFSACAARNQESIRKRTKDYKYSAGR